MKGLYMPQVYYYKNTPNYTFTHLFIEIDIG